MLDGTIDGYESYEAAVAAQTPSRWPIAIAGTDMLYSSGTTGRPKGVLPGVRATAARTAGHRRRPACSRCCSAWTPRSVYLSPAPLYHAAPLRFCMATLAIGATVVVMEHFDAEQYLELVERYQVTHSQVVPTMFVRMLKLPDDVRSQLRRVVARMRHPRRRAVPGPGQASR